MMQMQMQRKFNQPSRLRRSLTAGAAMLLPVLPMTAAAQDGVLVIDSRGASVERAAPPPLASGSFGYSNGSVTVDMSVLGGALNDQRIQLRQPRRRMTPELAVAPPVRLPSNILPPLPLRQLAVAPQSMPQPAAVPVLQKPYSSPRLPPRRPRHLDDAAQAWSGVQLAAKPELTPRPQSFNRSKIIEAPPPRLRASPAPVMRPELAEAPAQRRRHKPVPPIPAGPSPAPMLAIPNLPPVLPERQPAPRPAPGSPPPKQAPLVRLAPARPGLPPAASINTAAAPPQPFTPVRQSPAPAVFQPRGPAFAPTFKPVPPPPASFASAPLPAPSSAFIPSAPNMAPPNLPAPAPERTIRSSQLPEPPPAAFVPAPPPLPAPPKAVLTTPPTLFNPPSRQATPSTLPAPAPSPATIPAAPILSAPVHPVSPPLPVPPPVMAAPANNGLVTPPPLPNSASAKIDRRQLASLPDVPAALSAPVAPKSQNIQLAALPAAEPSGTTRLSPPPQPFTAPAPLERAPRDLAPIELIPVISAPLEPAPLPSLPAPPSSFGSFAAPSPIATEAAATRPMAPPLPERAAVESDYPQLASLPEALRVEQSRPVPAMAIPTLPQQSAAEPDSLPPPPSRADIPTGPLPSAEELLGGTASDGIAPSEELKRRFPIIFDRQEPPAMAKPDWSSAAPNVAAATMPTDLAPLATLAPRQQSPEPRRLLAALPPTPPLPTAQVPLAPVATPQLPPRPDLASRPLPNLISQPVPEPRSFSRVRAPVRALPTRPALPVPLALPVTQMPALAVKQPATEPGSFDGLSAPPPRALPATQAPVLATARPDAPPRAFDGINAPPSVATRAPLAPLPPSLINPPQRPARLAAPGILPQPIPSAIADLRNSGLTQPGSAVLAPPPPPARAPEIAARPESQSALPIPASETATSQPRRGLSIPPSLARVVPPQIGGSTEPRRLLTPPPIDDLSQAPGFAPLPLPEPPIATAPPAELSTPERLSSLAPPTPSNFGRPAPLATSIAAANFETEIAFTGGSRSLPGDAMPALAAIADRMIANPGLQARVSGAAAAGDAGDARDVALARALAVQRYLLSRGVLSDAIKVEPVSGGQSRDGVSVTLIVPA